jgi:addiction module HigA family antidote
MTPMFNPPHPGKILRRCFTSRAKADAAASKGITYPQLTAIYEGRASITPELSAKLSVVLGTGDGLWLRVQTQFDEWQVSPAGQ